MSNCCQPENKSACRCSEDPIPWSVIIVGGSLIGFLLFGYLS